MANNSSSSVENGGGDPMDKFTELNLVRSKKYKAAVWMHFGHRPDELDHCVCVHCGGRLKYSGNTTNLRNHLKSMHRQDFDNMESANGQQMLHALESSPNLNNLVGPSRVTLSYPEPAPFSRQHANVKAEPNSSSEETISNPRQRERTNQLIRFLAMGLHPLSTVEEPAFLDFLKTLDPNFSPPTVASLAKIITGKAQRVEMELVDHLSSANRVALSLELCKSPSDRADRYFSVLSAQFVDESWSMSNRVLSVSSSNVLSSSLSITLEAYLPQKLINEGKLSVLVVDSTDPVLKLELEREFAAVVGNEGRLNLKLLPCFCHVLDAAVKQALPYSSLEFVIKKTRGVVELFSKPDNANARVSQLPSNPFKRDFACSSWIDICMMLEMWLAKRESITADLEHLNRVDLMLDSDESIAIENLVKVLGPLTELAAEFSDKPTVTVSCLLPTLHHLVKSLLISDVGDSMTIKNMKESILGDLRKNYFEEQSVAALLKKACFLDARLKGLPFMSDAEKEEVRDLVKAELKEKARGQSVSVGTLVGNVTPPPPKKARSSLSLLQSMYGQAGSSTSDDNSFGEEIARYVACKTPDLESDPLSFWAINWPLYPNLAALARKYLPIRATNVPAEKIFKVDEGRFCNYRRDMLEEEKVDELMFLNGNLE